MQIGSGPWRRLCAVLQSPLEAVYGVPRPERPRSLGKHADVAQLVEHHLAKVRVAGSNPVVRSERVSYLWRGRFFTGGVAERRGNGLQSRVHGFESRTHLAWAIGAAGARFPDTEEVTGSIPVSRTEENP